MTRPIYEPTDPRAIRKNKWGINQLERRPSPVGGAAQINYCAIATAGLTSLTLDGNDPISNDSLWMTPGAPYDAEGGDPTDFVNIMITESGCYRGEFYVYWSTDFTAATFPFIEPGCVIDSVQDSLVNTESLPFFGPVWDNTQSWIGGEQFTAAEMDHHSVHASVIFNFDFTVAGISTFGISNVLRSSFAGAKTVGAKLAVYRISDYMEATAS